MNKQIIKEVTDKGPDAFYLLNGDEFLTKELAGDIINAYLDESSRSFNLITMDGQSLDMEELISNAKTTSLFGKNKVILVERASIFSSKEDSSKFIKKIINAWGANRRNAAFRALGQIMSAHGLGLEDIQNGPEMIARALNLAPDSEEVRTVAAVAGAMSSEDIRTPGAREEKALEELLDSGVPDGTVLIFTTESVDKRKKIYKKFDKHGRVIELEVRKERYSPGMDKGFFREQLREILSGHGKEMEAKALDAVYKKTGTDMRQFYAEVEKLVRYVGARKKITEEDVESIYGDFHEIAFFDLNKAIRSGDIKASLIALRDNLSVAEHPLQTLGMIANEFRRLILARELLFTSFKKIWKPNMTYNEFKTAANEVKKEASPRKNLGRLDPISMKDYALYNYMKDAQRFQMATLVQVLEMILETDMQLKGAKGGGGDPGIIVESLVMNICAAIGKRG